MTVMQYNVGKRYFQILSKVTQCVHKNMKDDNFPITASRKEGKYDQSLAAMILCVKRYFELESSTGRRINLKKIFESAACATEVSALVV